MELEEKGFQRDQFLLILFQWHVAIIQILYPPKVSSICWIQLFRNEMLLISGIFLIQTLQ